MNKKLALAALLSIGATSPAMAQNLLVNGGFDGDNVPTGGYVVYNAGDTIGGGGWTVLGAGGNSSLNAHTAYVEPGVAFVSQAGANALDLTGAGNTGPLDGIIQTVATTVGQAYLLSFYVGNADGNGNYLLPSSLTLSIGGGTPVTYTNSDITAGTINWKYFSTSFVASSSSTSIQFNNATAIGDNYAGLDTVVLSAVPEPATWAMMIAGFGIVGGAMRRQRKAKTTVRFA